MEIKALEISYFLSSVPRYPLYPVGRNLRERPFRAPKALYLRKVLVFFRAGMHLRSDHIAYDLKAH